MRLIGKLREPVRAGFNKRVQITRRFPEDLHGDRIPLSFVFYSPELLNRLVVNCIGIP